MTPVEARAMSRLEPPLVFGNPEQIEAADFLAAITECRAFLNAAEKAGYDINKQCPCCHGRGVSRCMECSSEITCHECDGDGTIDISAEDCATSAEAKNMLIELRRKFPEVHL